MTTVTSLTADRMLAIEAASVVDGDVVGGNLILTKHDGSQINAGSVTGAQGPPGPVGQDLVVASAVPVLDVGLVNQIRAGRQLTAADFTNMGLSAPLGLWNLSDLSDVSGNGRNLLNKGVTSFTSGINGLANTAAYFYGNNSQALYIPDGGSSDPIRKFQTGSIGCWFRISKLGVSEQVLMGRVLFGGATIHYVLEIVTANVFRFLGSADGSTWGINIGGVSNVVDDRWHFAVVTLDGTSAKIYIDGVLEASSGGPLLTNGIICPFNIGGYGADGGNNAFGSPFGRIDEAFVTADVLSENQIRNLYCAKLPHTLASVPSRLSLNVRRRRKGATLAVADFSTPPLRLYNFSGGSRGDEGSNGIVLTDNGVDLSPAVDGSAGNAFHFNGGRQLTATDTGLPSGLNPRSFGCWFKSSYAGNFQGLVGWGSSAEQLSLSNGGSLIVRSGGNDLTGPFVADGQWHFGVCTEDNTVDSGVKRKIYLDGGLVAASTVLNSLTLAGAAGFTIGAWGGSSLYMVGQIDGVFVTGYAMSSDEIAKLYAKGSQALTPSPKNVGDHVEAMDAANILATFDTLESQHQIDLRVAS